MRESLAGTRHVKNSGRRIIQRGVPYVDEVCGDSLTVAMNNAIKHIKSRVMADNVARLMSGANNQEGLDIR